MKSYLDKKIEKMNKELLDKDGNLIKKQDETSKIKLDSNEEGLLNE